MQENSGNELAEMYKYLATQSQQSIPGPIQGLNRNISKDSNLPDPMMELHHAISLDSNMA